MGYVGGGYGFVDRFVDGGSSAVWDDEPVGVRRESRTEDEGHGSDEAEQEAGSGEQNQRIG